METTTTTTTTTVVAITTTPEVTDLERFFGGSRVVRTPIESVLKCIGHSKASFEAEFRGLDLNGRRELNWLFIDGTIAVYGDRGLYAFEYLVLDEFIKDLWDRVLAEEESEVSK